MGIITQRGNLERRYRASRRRGLNGSRSTRREDLPPHWTKLLGAEDMAKAIGRSVRVGPHPFWLFMKTARMAACKIELMSNVHCKVDDHRRNVFELGAPTTGVFGAPSFADRRMRYLWPSVMLSY